MAGAEAKENSAVANTATATTDAVIVRHVRVRKKDAVAVRCPIDTDAIIVSMPAADIGLVADITRVAADAAASVIMLARTAAVRGDMAGMVTASPGEIVTVGTEVNVISVAAGERAGDMTANHTAATNRGSIAADIATGSAHTVIDISAGQAMANVRSDLRDMRSGIATIAVMTGEANGAMTIAVTNRVMRNVVIVIGIETRFSARSRESLGERSGAVR